MSKFNYRNFTTQTSFRCPEIASPEPALSGKTGFFPLNDSIRGQNDRSEGACNDSKAEVSLRGALATKQSKFIVISSVFMLGLTLASPSYGELPGEGLFNKKCKQCHKTTEQVLIGPGLKDVTKRRSIEWIEKWLIDPKKVLNSDDPIAQELKKSFKRVMPKIPEMSTDENRKDIIEYLKTL